MLWDTSPRRPLRLVGFLAATLLIAAACESTADSPSPGSTDSPAASSGGPAIAELADAQTVRFPINTDVGSLDPAQLNSVTDYALAANIFSGLLRFDDAFQIQPDLAEALPDISEDGLTYTFRLRVGARFSNGDPVTASDVIFSWDRAATLGGPYASNLSAIEGYDAVAADGSSLTHMTGLTAPDEHTVVVKLAHPAGYFLTQVAGYPYATAVLDERVVQEDNEDWWTEPTSLVGSGPYKLTARVPKQSLEFTRVDDYWAGQTSRVKDVIIEIVPDLTTAIAKFDQGGYDIVGYGGMNLQLPAADVLRIKSGPTSDQLHLQPVPTTLWVGLNFEKGPFQGTSADALALRRAFAMAIDPAQLNAIVCANGTVCTPATGGLIPKGLKGYLGDAADPLAEFNPEQARQLLATADPDGSGTRGLVYATSAGEFNKTLAENLQSQWKQNLGVDVGIDVMESPQFVQRRVKHEFIMLRAGWAADYDHPQNWFDNNFVSGAGNGVDGYSNPALDDLVKRADQMQLSEALPLYEQASRLMIDDVRYRPLVYLVGGYLAKPYVAGAGQNSFTDFSWQSLSVLKH